MNSTDGADVAVIGGGMIGSAVAYGLARRGARVIQLDEGDRAAVWDSRVTCHYLVLRYPELGSALDMTLHASAHHGALPSPQVWRPPSSSCLRM